jgi:hypothetical protein
MNIAPEPFTFFTSGLADSLSLPASSTYLKSHLETNASEHNHFLEGSYHGKYISLNLTNELEI